MSRNRTAKASSLCIHPGTKQNIEKKSSFVIRTFGQYKHAQVRATQDELVVKVMCSYLFVPHVLPSSICMYIKTCKNIEGFRLITF